MTIYTPGVAQSKPEDADKPKEVPLEAVTATKGAEEEYDNYVNVAVYRRSPTKLTNAFILLAALSVLAVGVVGGIYLYRHLTHKSFTAWCGTPYLDDRYDEPHKAFLREHIEVDPDLKYYEKIEVPKFDECASALILHDFQRNLTAIVDRDHARCFVMPLDRRHVTPPHDFWDLIMKMRTGYYIPDSTVVRQRFRVVQPPIQDQAILGQYISMECSRFDTYRLRKVSQHNHHHRHRRGADQCKFNFGDFNGNQVVKFCIE